MAKTRRVARRHRRWRQKENKKRALKKLKRIEDQICGYSPFSRVWWVKPPKGLVKVLGNPPVFTPHRAGKYLVSVDMGKK